MRTPWALRVILIAVAAYGYAPVPNAGVYPAGDANCDGRLEQTDLRALILEVFAATGCPGADANGDGTVSAADAVRLVGQLAGLAVTPSASAPPSPTATTTGMPVGTPATPTPSASSSAASTVSPTPAATLPPLPTTRPTLAPTATPSPTATSGYTRTPARTLKPRRTPTRTRFPTFTPSRTRTPTRRFTRTVSATPSVTRTPSRTPTGTATPTSTRSPTITQTRTPTIPLPVGPLVTYFGVTSASAGCDVGGNPPAPIGRTADDIPIYCREVGSGFKIVVEGRPGSSGSPVGASAFNSDPQDPSTWPDIQIESNRDLGSGNPLVCEPRMDDPPPLGGIPRVDPARFEVTQPIADALNDFGCRFADDVHPRSDDACTCYPLGVPQFVDPASTMQFCATVSLEMKFPEDETRLTVRLRDRNGNAGNVRQIAVRAPCVAPETPAQDKQ